MSGFYEALRQRRGDDGALADCIRRTTQKLLELPRGDDRPGMLLGRIQSGKTRAFIGIIAQAFDSGFDIAVVFTKPTLSLSTQTEKRLKADFAEFIERDQVLIFDIMHPQGQLTPSELRRKIVVIAKKQTHNLDRVQRFLTVDYPELRARRVLVVDDEADLASIRFVAAGDEVEQGAIAGKLDDLRRQVAQLAYLQVTATPYSLYLQPERYDGTHGFVFKPMRPAFTELLPRHGDYVGGDDFFRAADDSDPCSRIFVEVDAGEQDALRKPDGRRVPAGEELRSKNTRGLVRSLITFALAASVRRWQQERAGERPGKYAMVVHNDPKKRAQEWQCELVRRIADALVAAATAEFKAHFDHAFEDLRQSVEAARGEMPPTAEMADATAAVLREETKLLKINSDEDVVGLLDDRGELELRTACNIFVGGNILDPGITIPKLIAFYYGRNPKTTQADTALQHSRMYGARDRRDLAVTRLYTSRLIYDRLFSINALENTLRQAFESGAHDSGVVFICTGPNGGIRPCAPNKIRLSNVVALGPGKLYCPTSFQLDEARGAGAAADRDIASLIPPAALDSGDFAAVAKETALRIISTAQGVIDLPEGEFDWNAMRAMLDYYGGSGEVLLTAATGRRLAQARSGDKTGLSIIGAGLRSLVERSGRKLPALVLLRQELPAEAGGWEQPFWWPVLAAPTDAEPCVFAQNAPVE
ncbi:MAG: Z1 domain-containing protein [Terriglobales bacterium]